ncbi:type II toxin-antitoxin system VapC family toxin [Dolichospermum circinale]|uniref:type II toxin-antitoxin system VapC family toxin n=1 Tax=Dolichospermum circinale TaxID=109265 RepID=UPI0003FAAA04|nr:PIN domain-containing protein [Dolichospermum circinale]MDB9458965.1 PIN domain-containing protein [Dolichospermum circinale CS-545/17]MDB9465889.1 PIN domain-containing protein [Dolichospermum circinale CS-539/09]MDB9472619.1 PIN domain-containing protein [Dolichospermum circinale CS-539]
MIIVDTGFWLALIDQKDTYHETAKQALKKYNEPLMTTWCVVTETCYLLLTRKGVQAQVTFLNSLEQELFTVFNLESHHTPRIIQLMEKYANLPMDLADASLVILAEYLGHGRIFSVDQRDFNTYRWKQTYPFENLLF